MLLTVHDLTVRYGAFVAVAGVSFTVAPGEIVALIGPNGAGKSSCFNAINGQCRPQAGSVRLAGRDITGLSPAAIWRLGVGRTFQITATLASMTVCENVQMALISHARQQRRLWPAARRLHRVEAEALLAGVGLAAHADRPCAILSYGDLKRLELAIALAHQPRLLLMDEPTAGMAAAERGALMGLAAALCHSDGIGILFTEHDIDLVFAHADRVLVLNRGSVLASGSPAQIRGDAAVKEVYLGGGATFAIPEGGAPR